MTRGTIGRRLPLWLAAFAMVLAGCSGGARPERETAPNAAETTAGGPKRAETVKFSVAGDERTLTPYTYVTGSPGSNLLHLVYDALLVLDQHNEPQPLLASQVESSTDSRTYTLTLRDDVTWHDGARFSADDVMFTFDYVKKHAHDRWTGEVSPVESVNASGNRVVITLKEPDPAFLLRPLADLPMLPRHVWESVDEPKAATIEQAIGTGPYRLVEYVPGQRYRFQANERHVLGPPSVDELIVPIIPEPASAFAAVRTGELDTAFQNLAPQLVSQFEATRDLAVRHGPGFRSELLQFNNQHPLLTRTQLRQAIAQAIDVQELVDTVLLGRGMAGNPGFAHPASPLALEPIEHDFDPDGARQQLEALGYRQGPDGVRFADGKPLRFTLIADAADPTRVRSAELIREMLADVGIGVTVETMERNSVLARVWPDFDVSKGRNFEMAMFGWSPPVMLDPARIGHLVHSDPRRGSMNVGGFRDSSVDALVAQFDTAADPQRRKELVQKLQEAIAHHRPFVTLMYPDLIYGYRPHAYDGWIFQDGQGIIQKLSFIPLR